jgi:hypothetical protein
MAYTQGNCTFNPNVTELGHGFRSQVRMPTQEAYAPNDAGTS